MKIILDLDDTLCFIDHRKKYYGVDWDKYNLLIPYDKLNSVIDKIVSILEYGGFEVIILTGRYETYRDLTQSWLRDNISFSYRKLIMKQNNDNTSSIRFKSEWIRANCSEGDIVIDDREEISELCKELNLTYIRPNKYDKAI